MPNSKKIRCENLCTSNKKSHTRKCCCPAQTRHFVYVKIYICIFKFICQNNLSAASHSLFSRFEFLFVLTVEDRFGVFMRYCSQPCCNRSSLYPPNDKTWQHPFTSKTLFTIKRTFIVLFIIFFLICTDAAVHGGSQSQHGGRQRAGLYSNQ